MRGRSGRFRLTFARRPTLPGIAPGPAFAGRATSATAPHQFVMPGLGPGIHELHNIPICPTETRGCQAQGLARPVVVGTGWEAACYLPSHPPAGAAIGVAEPATSGHHSAPFLRCEQPMPTALAATSKRRAAIGVISLLLLLLVPAAPARAAGPVFLEELTWTELRDLVKPGRPTIPVPAAGARPE